MTQPPTEPPNIPPPPPVAPPGYGAPVPPPQPQKKNTGMIIGIVAGVLVLIGAIVLAVVLLAGSDDSDDSDAKDDASSSTESDESEDPEESEEPDGEVLQGTGYSYELPEGWNDISADVEAQDTSGTIDSVSAPGESLEKTFANVIVESGPANGETDLEAARDQVATNLGGSVGVTPEEIDGPTVDGQESVGLQLTRKNATGIEVLQDAYVMVRDDVYYVIGFSRDSSKDEYDEDLEEILASWTWDE